VNVISKVVAYLFLRTDKNGSLLAFSVKFASGGQLESGVGWSERKTCESLFSFLRTEQYHTLIVSITSVTTGVSNAYKLLKGLYNKYSIERYIYYIDAIEIINFDKFVRRYGQRLPVPTSASTLQEIDEAHSVYPYLIKQADEVGMPCHCLLDSTTEELLFHFNLQGTTKKIHGSILLKDMIKSSTRLGVLQALFSGPPEVFALCVSLPQKVCLRVLHHSHKEIQEIYNEFRSDIDAVEVGEYVYSKMVSPFFQPIDTIICLLDIPMQSRVGESAKNDSSLEEINFRVSGEFISNRRYRIELNKSGVLTANVFLTDKQIEQLKLLLPNLEREKLNLVYRILKE
jgi:hypothetical protein